MDAMGVAGRGQAMEANSWEKLHKQTLERALDYSSHSPEIDPETMRNLVEAASLSLTAMLKYNNHYQDII